MTRGIMREVLACYSSYAGHIFVIIAHRAGYLFGSGCTCQGKEAACQDLDLYLWPIAKTEIPVGMAGCSALGHHDYVSIMLSPVYEGGGRDRSTRTPSCSGEQQRRHSVPNVANFAVGLLVASNVVLAPVVYTLTRD